MKDKVELIMLDKCKYSSDFRSRVENEKCLHHKRLFV